MTTTPDNAQPSTNKSKRSKKPSAIRIGKRYRANRIDDHYDAIVIGSGIEPKSIDQVVTFSSFNTRTFLKSLKLGNND